MRQTRQIESLIRKLQYTASTEAHERVLGSALHALDDSTEATPVNGPPRRTASLRPAIAAASLAIVLVGGALLWRDRSPGEWWLQPPTAWAAEVMAALEPIEALVYRRQFVFVGKFGSTHISGNWSLFYTAKDRRRIDRYYGDTLVGTKWEVPEADGSQTHYHVSYEYECYGIAPNQDGRKPRDPVQLLRFYVDLLDKADRRLATETFEGRRCVGFEISAAKYGDNPPHWIDRVWMDVETKMPVRIENHGRPITGQPEQTGTLILDQFKYHVQLPTDMFQPKIPEGFVEAHPDEIRSAREREEKGETPFADVPEGLKGDLVAALDQFQTAVYRESGRKVYLSRHAWRVDHFAGERLFRVEWFVIEKKDMAPTSFDFNDKNFRLTHTSVNLAEQTYRQVLHGKDTRPRHPMDRIRFIIGQVDRADRILEDSVIDGIECFGLEISAKKYGTNPDDKIHRLWFDAETRLPVRFEFEFLPDGARRKVAIVKDQFEWDPELPPDFFAPEIPPGFTADPAPAEGGR